MNYSYQQFQDHFRMPPEAFEMVLIKLQPLYTMKMELRKALMATIWLLASGSCYRTVSELFGIPKATFCRTVHHICKIIYTAFPDIVHYDRPIGKFIVNIEYYDIQRAKFGHRYGVPNVVCAIDGTFMQI